jgi:hypothetical protein
MLEDRLIAESGKGATAFFTKVSKRGKGKGKSEEDAKKYCTHCKIKGHDMSECQKLKREQETKSETTSTAAKPDTTTASAKMAVAQSYS